MVLTYLYRRSNGLFGIGIDGVPALRAFRLEYPGFEGLGPGAGTRRKDGRRGETRNERRSLHLSFSRRECLDPAASGPLAASPASLPEAPWKTSSPRGSTTGSSTKRESKVRIRLESTVVRVLHQGSPESAKEVEVAYVRRGEARRVRARHAVLACWNSVIPYLCPEMPEGQRKALSYAVKVPLTYTNVGIRNWTSFQKLGNQLGLLSGKLLRERVPRFPREPGLLSVSPFPRGADGPPSHEKPGEPRSSSERAVPGGTIRASLDDVRDVREERPRSARQDSRRGGLRPRDGTSRPSP